MIKLLLSIFTRTGFALSHLFLYHSLHISLLYRFIVIVLPFVKHFLKQTKKMISIPRISSGCVIKKSRIFLLCFIGIFWHVRLVTSADDKLGKVRCTNDSSGIPQCTCPEEPITERYRDTSDSTCEFYYLCHLGRAMKRKCFPYYAFHPELQECLPRNRIPSNICKPCELSFLKRKSLIGSFLLKVICLAYPVVQCPLRPNRYVEDQKDCSKYYLCMFGRPSHWSCPGTSKIVFAKDISS